MDEGLGGVYMTNCIARLADPLSATVIFDKVIWEGPATEFILPANPYLVLAGGTMIAAPTLAELAQKLGLPTVAFERTIEEYNSAVASGQAGSLTPHRTTIKTQPRAVTQPPFLAVRLAAGVTYTMGGIAIDSDGRVLDEHRRPIPGLYASGCCTGGVEGGATSGYVGGLTKSTVISQRAAKAIAQYQTPSQTPSLAPSVAGAMSS
jgi:fumarate reductase flavoprotein subunit